MTHDMTQQEQKKPFSLEEIEKAPCPVLDKDPAQALKQVAGIIGDMCQFYARENKELKAANAQGFLNLQGEKMILARNYQSIVQQMRARQADMATAPQALKDKITSQENNFHALADENKALLKRLEKGTDRLRNRIVDTVKDVAERKRTNAYSNSGQLMKNQRRPLSTGLEETA